jgi:hypothetical protein
VNIVFVEHDTAIPIKHFSTWRGKMFYEAIKRTGLHNTTIIKSSEFSQNSQLSTVACLSSQLIVIEGSLDIDLLIIVNYWKSRGKKVVVDIPIPLEQLINANGQHTQNSFSISQMYSSYQNKVFNSVDKLDRFRWGLHLADCILVSSVQQLDLWRVTAPVRLIPEFVDIDSIRDTIKIDHGSFTIGVLTNALGKDELLESVISTINNNYPNVTLLPVAGQNVVKTIEKNAINYNLPAGISTQWRDIITILDYGIVWDVHDLRGEYFKNLLDMMILKIPWAVNEIKGYQDLAKYGLIIQNKKSWQPSLIESIQKSIQHVTDGEGGYLYAIGHNIEDRVHEILMTFNEIIKISA